MPAILISTSLSPALARKDLVQKKVIVAQASTPPPPAYPQPYPPPAYPYAQAYPPPPAYPQPYPPAYPYPPQTYPYPQAYPVPPGPAQIQADLNSGLRLRNVGRALTITSLVLIPLGAILLGSSVACGGTFYYSSDFSYYSADSGCVAGLLATGALFEAVGIPLLLAGAPLWGVGNAKINRVRQLGYPVTATLQPKLQFGPQGQSAGLAMSLQF